jgi:PKD repeat protein
MPGEWQMQVTGVDIAPGGETITASVSGSTDLTLSIDFDKIEYIPNEPMVVIAELKDSLGPILGASVVANIQTPSTTDTLTLYDDGVHQDGAANDGVYANSYTNTSERGSYTFKVDASGTSNTGDTFTRTATKSTVVGKDSDNDGMPDVWEDIYGLDKYRDDSGEDPDNDGLTNLEEYTYRTHPKNPDTDGDGYNDGDEVKAGSDPNDSKSIPNQPPVADPNGPYTGTEGQPITLDGSGSSDSDGTIVKYEWDVDNDGNYDYSSSSPTQNHTYAQQGTYTIKLRVTDNLGATDEATTTANILDTSPTADFTASPTSGIAPLTVNFTNNSTGYDQPLSYEWDFDNDGIVDSTDENPSYTYINPGTYTVKLTATDLDRSTDTLIKTDYINVKNYTLTCPDGGAIECLERTNGGSDSDNLDSGMPKVDIEYEFRINVKDSSGNTPQYVRLYMTQRNSPQVSEFYVYEMTCSGDYSTGATCTYLTKLGPAAIHKFYFEAKMSDETILRYPESGYITGPEVQLLRGYNLVGIPRDINSADLDGNTAFGTTRTYRWNTDLEYYTKVTTTEPVKAGEGYFVYKEANTLPEHESYEEIQGAEYTYELKPGWNIISNPYSGNVRLLDIKVGKGSDTPLSWTEAVTKGWLVNAIYYYKGIDWGGTYAYETEPQATLVPWIGYWVHLNVSDDTYYLIIPKPAQ